MQSKSVILILGDTDPSEAHLAEAARYGEVFVLARAVPDAGTRYVVDDELADRRARLRLGRAAAHLRASGVRVSGLVGDPDARAARRDAVALFPQASALLQAA